MSTLAEGALWATLGGPLAFALLSRCQRHRQRGPWYYAEGPPPSRALRDFESLVGTPTASIPHSQSPGGYARWTLSTAPHMAPLHISRTTGRGIP